MAVLEKEIITQELERPAGMARPRLWNADEYHLMAEVGIIGPDERIELIEGEIYTMSPINAPHASAVYLTLHALQEAFGKQFYVHTQSPVQLSATFEPQPDAYVARGTVKRYFRKNPQLNDLLLVVEVSNSSLAFDKNKKGQLYSSSGIPEYWIVNLIDRCLEVYREPSVNSAYGTVTIHGETDVVTPLGTPEAKISVASLLPDRDEESDDETSSEV